MEHLVDEIRSRPGCSATVWYLRRRDHLTAPPGTRVVDELRTWPPAALLRMVGFETGAGRLRGLRLRRWLDQVSPDVVVLDDGLGSRVVEPLGDRPGIVVRRNATLPTGAESEQVRTTGIDLVIVDSHLERDRRSSGARDSGTQDPPTIIEYRYESTDGDAIRYETAELRRSVRRSAGLPVDEPLVVGWGDDGWLDGPELFLRCLWALEHRHQRRVHGAWFGVTDDQQRTRLHQEADRLGVTDRFHLRGAANDPARLTAEVVVFPYRTVADRTDVRNALLSGAAVVAFEAARTDDPSIRRVRDLDVDAAAQAIMDALTEDPGPRLDDVRRRLDVRTLVDRLLDTRRH